MDMKLELVPMPVTDIDRAKRFYVDMVGFNEDLDVQPTEGMRIVQLTPTGSACSIVLSTGLPALAKMAPGTIKGLHLVVADVSKVREMLAGRGVEVSEVDEHPRGIKYVRFSDPDGNSWLLQEVTTRLPGRVEQAGTAFASANDLASALPRAAGAHGEHEKRIGQHDANWPDWYATYMVAEQAGQELPQ